MNKRSLIDIAGKHTGRIILCTMVLIAFLSFDHYGIGWDEPQQRETGIVNYKYIFSGDNSLLQWPDRDYGVAFELPLIFIEKALNLNQTREIYLMRHLLTHLFFLLGAYFLFRIIDYLYKNKLLAALGFILLLSHLCQKLRPPSLYCLTPTLFPYPTLFLAADNPLLACW